MKERDKYRKGEKEGEIERCRERRRKKERGTKKERGREYILDRIATWQNTETVTSIKQANDCRTRKFMAANAEGGRASEKN